MAALNRCIHRFPKVSLQLLDSVYPMGDEVVLIYEATGRVVRPGGLPIEEGIAVFNVETMYNIYRALKKNKPVTDKLVTIVGEVESPVTIPCPSGTALQTCVEFAGGRTNSGSGLSGGRPYDGKHQRGRILQ